ncbi:MAG: radical SAM protein [Pseudomonadota bacterium]
MRDELPITTFEERERLHVDIGSFCNNNCLFCMEDDRRGRASRVGSITPAVVRRILEANVFREEVVFVSGEPTLNPHFLEYVRQAKVLGYRSVGVISNGRRFAYEPFTKGAVLRGLNHVIISLHGGNARIHDALVRAPGAFDQARDGILHLSALKRRGAPLRIHSSTVLNTRNAKVEVLTELVDFLRQHVDQMVFNIMQPFGRGLRHLDRLMLRYTEMGQVLGRFFAESGLEDLPIYLVDIPYCVTEGVGIPDGARGFVERYVHYDRDTSDGGFAGDLQEGGSPLRRELLEAEGAVPVDGLVEKHRDQQEQSKKLRRPACDTCAFSRVCDGVWRNYIDRFGWDEFNPVIK